MARETRSIGRKWLVGFKLCCCLVWLASIAGAQTITVNNRLANLYAYDPFPNPCPGGMTVSNIPSGFHLERPHAVFNSSTNRWVLWAHYDNSNYTTASALVATSPTQCGPYTISSIFQPLGRQVRDDFLFKDTDGTAYFIAASNKNGGANDTMAIFKLTSDYLAVDSSAGMTWVFDGAFREAPIVLKNGSTYFLLTSQAAGWFPSQGAYATSTSMMSGWSALSNLGNSSTFGGQNARLKTIQGTATTSYVLVLDHLGGNTARDDGALWLPLTFSGNTVTMNWYTSYQVNLTTGALTLPPITNLAAGRPATASSSAAANPPNLAADGNYGTRWIASAAAWPSWWMVDLGAARAIGEIDISWYMVKGSEGYYQYRIAYSTDGANFTTLDRTDNVTYGFTSDQVNFSARYVRVELVNAVLWNNPNNWYTPQLWDVRILPPAQTVINVSNNSFEAPATGTYAYNPSGGSWTFSGASPSGSGVSANGSGFTAGNPAAPQGTQVAFLQRTGTISQSIGGFVAGRTYTITFSAAQRANKSGGQPGQTWNVVVNGLTVASFAPPRTATGYEDYEATFTATATTNTIGFSGTNLNGGDNTVFID
ncbi:MAG TPA: discoidin domain-containing protein, partial [Blastocatellia bacterium]|nr:discoidin domain-containing protein [Blastocatellia bacterium]